MILIELLPLECKLNHKYMFPKFRNDFILESESGHFSIDKGQLLVGNVHLVQRDPDVFEKPEEFLPSRFKDEVSWFTKSHLLRLQ